MPSQELPQEFRRQLDQAGLQFTLPPGFGLTAPIPNDSVAYHCAIALPEPKLEIRYHIVALKREPLPAGFTSVASVNLNAMHDTYLAALIYNVADRVLADPNPLPTEAVQAEFNANRGAICRLVLKPDAFSAGFNECMLLALHRDDLADVYIFYMFDKFEQVAEVMGNNFHTLTFAKGNEQ